jgi:hypothetical protein
VPAEIQQPPTQPHPAVARLTAIWCTAGGAVLVTITGMHWATPGTPQRGVMTTLVGGCVALATIAGVAWLQDRHGAWQARKHTTLEGQVAALSRQVAVVNVRLVEVIDRLSDLEKMIKGRDEEGSLRQYEEEFVRRLHNGNGNVRHLPRGS